MRRTWRLLTQAFLVVLFLAACTSADGEVQGPSPASSAPPPPIAHANTPRARAYAVMADAPGSGVVLLGGQYGTPPGTPLSDLWTYGPGEGWSEISEETGKGTDAFAYDSGSNRLVAIQESKTWIFDPKNQTWHALETRAHPRDVWGSRIAYDAGSDRIILFGGFDGSTLSDQTWALDIDGRGWEQMQPNLSPPPQNFHAMAYDADADRVILFSGGGQEGTWAYDYETDAWTDLSPRRSPEARDYSALVYDAVRERTILFGGATGSSEDPLGDTWAYDFQRNTWTRLSSESAPSPRGWHSMAFDAATGMIVLFSGGVTRDTDLDDLWLFDPATDTWSPVR